MFTPPVRLEEWVALNAAVVADAPDDTTDTADTASSIENATDNFLTSDSSNDDGENGADTGPHIEGLENAALFYQPTFHIPMDGPGGDIQGANPGYMHGSWANYFDGPGLSDDDVGRRISADILARGALDCDNPDVLNGLDFDVTNQGWAVYIQFSYDSSFWSNVPPGQYVVTFSYCLPDNSSPVTYSFILNLTAPV